MKLKQIYDLIQRYDSNLIAFNGWTSYLMGDHLPLTCLRMLYKSIYNGHKVPGRFFSSNPSLQNIKEDLTDHQLIYLFSQVIFVLPFSVSHVQLRIGLYSCMNEREKLLGKRVEYFEKNKCPLPTKYFTSPVKGNHEQELIHILYFYPDELIKPEYLSEFYEYLTDPENNINKFWFSRLYNDYANLFTNDNIIALQKNPNLRAFLEINLPPILATKPNLDTFVVHADMLCHCVSTLCRIPRHLFTQDVFNQIISIVEEAGTDDYKVIEDIQTYINFLLTPVAQIQNHIIIHGNTHAESIHTTVSRSAKKLYQTYKYQIDSNKKINIVLSKLKEWGESLLPKDFLNGAVCIPAAKAAINRLSNPWQTYTDPKSMISLRQLLAMSWLAINDISRLAEGRAAQLDLAVILKTAKDNLVEALYDCQRGYNTNNANFIDNNDEDANICPPGNFNKLMQALWFCQHIDVDLKYVTHETARDKLGVLIKEKTFDYLLYLHKRSEHSSKSQLELAAICKQIRTKYTLPLSVWNNIESDVKVVMLNEYGDLYPRGKNDQRLLSLLHQSLQIDVCEVELKFQSWLTDNLDSSVSLSSVRLR